jgi:hypothetical protein
MTDLDTAAAAPQPEVVAGLPLADDKALIARTPELHLPAIPSNGKLSSWSLIPHAATLARMVAATDFVPSGLRNKPASVAALMLLGHELGLGPMASMQAMTVTPHKTDSHGNDHGGDIITWARTLRALVRSHGHKIWPDPNEYTSQRVRWWGYRADDPEHVMSILWTMEEAKAAGLLEMPYGKPGPWQKQPRAQLSARASAELCRLLDEDGLLGISHVVEEMDEAERETIDIVDTAAATEVEHSDEPKADAPESGGTRRRSTRARTTPMTAAGAPQVDAPKVELEVPGDTPETQTGSQAPAAGTPPDNPSPVADLEVPGDEDRIQITDAGVAAAEAQAPTVDQVVDELNAATTVEHMPNDQKIAMLCREAGIDRAKLVSIMTDKRSDSAKDLSQSQSAFVIEHVRAVIRGEERFNASTIPPFVVIPDAELAEQARIELSRLAGGDRLRPTLASLGWDEEQHGKVTTWLSGLDRQKLLEVLGAARSAQPPTEATE